MTAEALGVSRGKSASIVLNIMAVVWCALTSPILAASWRIPVIVVATLISGLLIVRGTKIPPGPGRFDKKIFWLSVGFEAVVIPVAIYFLIAAHAPTFILSVTAIIVGLHFIGMWLATRRRDYLAVCAAMCALGFVAALLLPPLRMQVAGFGSALTLWIAAFRLSGRA